MSSGKCKLKQQDNHCTPIRMAKIWNIDIMKCWQGCGTAGTLIHCWWDCTMVQSFQRIVWRFLNHILTIWSSSHTAWYLSTGVENLCPHKTYTKMFITTLFYNCQNLEATKFCPSVDERINKLWYIQTVEYCLELKRNEISGLPWWSSG